ncbi:hypothetical protein M0R45_038022 [Rubus argutus]|uniref:F-box domain-containing protein n=1 Tax=Rubus argutus TaxID=59490 RepID=A0AAW1W424_RUBAR
MDEEGDSIRREDLPSDVLRKIFELFNDTSDLTWAIARVHCSAVCRAWRSILCDPQLWNTIDLSTMESDCIRIHFEPYVWVSTTAESRLNCVLKSALCLSKGNITALIFNLDLYVPDHLFTYTAERSRNLKRLVMPAWNRIQKAGIGKAIACWKDLESLTIGNIECANYLYLMSQISYNCMNLRELKLIGTCHLFASILVTYLPKLRVLSLRCSKLSNEDLITILDGLQDLEVLNISHCFVIRTPPGKGVITQLDRVILGKASRLRTFITCMKFQSCIMCKRAREDEGIIRWHKYEQGLWKQDEVNSLAL